MLGNLEVHFCSLFSGRRRLLIIKVNIGVSPFKCVSVVMGNFRWKEFRKSVGIWRNYDRRFEIYLFDGRRIV